MLLTDSFKPYLIECNASPSLYCDCEMDFDVKIELVQRAIEKVLGVGQNDNVWVAI